MYPNYGPTKTFLSILVIITFFVLINWRKEVELPLQNDIIFLLPPTKLVHQAI
jgi:hypothetical protein